MLAPFFCPECGDHPGYMTYDTEHGGTAPIAFSCKDSGLDSGETSPTLRSMNFDQSHANAGGQIAVAFNLRGREGGSQPELADQASPRSASGGSSRSYVAAFQEVAQPVRNNPYNNSDPGMEASMHIAHPMRVRRLLPVECCRLQGFPDKYLDITFNGKPAADGNKYKTLGNSMAVPCMDYIGRRLQLIDFLS